MAFFDRDSAISSLHSDSRGGRHSTPLDPIRMAAILANLALWAVIVMGASALFHLI